MPRHARATLLVHLVWTTKRRRQILPIEADPLLTDLFRKKADAAGCPLLGVGIASNHVHVIAKVATHVTLADLVQRLKGAVSFEVNTRSLLPTRLRWQTGYWAESFGPRSLDRLLRYVANQRVHHREALIARH